MLGKILFGFGSDYKKKQTDFNMNNILNTLEESMYLQMKRKIKFHMLQNYKIKRNNRVRYKLQEKLKYWKLTLDNRASLYS